MRWIGAWLLMTAVTAQGFTINIAPVFDGHPLIYDQVCLTNSSGQAFSVTRLDLLLSDIALQKTDGSWLEFSNQFAFIHSREGRTSVTLPPLSADTYTALRFSVGVAPDINHGDPAVWPPGHALNPSVNGMHWNWQGGYVFMALEGMWGNRLGYSFHLATDRQRFQIEIPVELKDDSTIEMALAVDRILDGIPFVEGESSTHSRDGDTVADHLRENTGRAFSITGLSKPVLSGVEGPVPPATEQSINVAPFSRAYRFTFSRFFPMPQLPRDNPLTVNGVELGNKLFHDPRLSINNTKSCASCHQDAAAMSDPGQRLSVGAEGTNGARHTMALFNLAWKKSFFWDGRAATLRDQMLVPIENPVEMHETMTNIVAKLYAAGDYVDLFAKTFGDPLITTNRIQLAIEQFMLSRVSCNSKFDRMLTGEYTFTEEETKGFELFNAEYDPVHGKFGGDCFHCHGGPLFISQDFANNGLDDTFTDTGLAIVTKRPGDIGKFAVPSLRNVEKTAPYMHDGRFATLEEVIDHYATGVKRSDTLDPNLAKHPNNGVPLSDEDKKAMIAFMKTLTDLQ